MKKPTRTIITAALIGATALCGCTDNKDNVMKKDKPSQSRHFQEPVCIYGPPEMLGAFDNISDGPKIDLPVPEDVTEDNVSDKDN